MNRSRAFSLVELLAVVAITALLLGMLAPAVSRARLQARIAAVNAELRQIGLGLEFYYFDHQKYPPTREDCHTGSLKDHLYQLPRELTEGGYLPAAGSREARTSIMEDRFNKGHTYKYRAAGECVRDRDRVSKWIKARLWAPDGFPDISSIAEEEGRWYSVNKEAPVKWVLFSVGPNFDEQHIIDTVGNRYPVPKEVWYSRREERGFLVRLRMQDGSEQGSFEGY